VTAAGLLELRTRAIAEDARWCVHARSGARAETCWPAGGASHERDKILVTRRKMEQLRNQNTCKLTVRLLLSPLTEQYNLNLNQKNDVGTTQVQAI